MLENSLVLEPHKSPWSSGM